jgi:hypothetical protein
MVYRGHVRNGRIELDKDVRLPEGAQVEVAVVSEVGPEDQTPGAFALRPTETVHRQRQGYDGRCFDQS